MSETISQVFLLIILVIINGLFSMTEMAVVSLRKARLQKLAEDGDSKARTAIELSENPNAFFSTIQIVISLVGVVMGAFGAQSFSDDFARLLKKVDFLAPAADTISLLLISLIITYFSLVIGELIPKRIATSNPEKISMAMGGFMKGLSKVFRPIVSLLSASTEFGLKLMGIQEQDETPVSEDEVKVMIEQGKQVGVFEENEQDIVESVFRMSDDTVDALMTPRTELTWIDLEEPLEESLKEILDSEYSYYPLVRGNPDNIVGVITAKNLLDAYIRKDEIDLEALAETPLYVPESKPALNLLDDLKESNKNFAIILDEYGGFSGMITPFEILEELVGNVASTGNNPEDDIMVRSDGSWSFDGQLDIDEFKDELNIRELPDENRVGYQTLGGFILSQIGSIPSIGDCFDWDKYHFEIVDMDGRRIDRVFVSLLEKPEGAPAPEESKPEAEA